MNLKNLINPQLELQVDGNRITILENNNEDKEQLRSVTITGLPPHHVFAFSTDREIQVSAEKKEKLLNQFLDKEPGKINSRCDGVVIHCNDHELTVVLCELKSLNPSGYEVQLINARLFVEYLVNLFNTFHNNSAKLEIKQVRYVLFTRKKALEEFRSLKAPKDDRPKTRERSMQQFEEKFLEVSCSKPQHNFIEWYDLIKLHE